MTVTTKNIGMGMSTAIMELDGARRTATMHKMDGRAWAITAKGVTMTFKNVSKQEAAEQFFAA